MVFYGLSPCAFGTRSRLVFDAISLPRRKEMAKEKTPGRSLRDLPWCARKRRGAARPLCSCLRELVQLQRLYLPLKAQRQTDRARIFAISFCLKFVRTRGRRRPKKRFLFCLRASFVLVLGLPSANARFEVVYLREKMSKARATRPFRAHQGIQGEPLASFLATSWGAPRSGIKMLTAGAHAVECERP